VPGVLYCRILFFAVLCRWLGSICVARADYSIYTRFYYTMSTQSQDYPYRQHTGPRSLAEDHWSKTFYILVHHWYHSPSANHHLSAALCGPLVLSIVLHIMPNIMIIMLWRCHTTRLIIIICEILLMYYLMTRDMRYVYSSLFFNVWAIGNHHLHCEPKRKCFCHILHKTPSILMKFGTHCPE